MTWSPTRRRQSEPREARVADRHRPAPHPGTRHGAGEPGPVQSGPRSRRRRSARWALPSRRRACPPWPRRRARRPPTPPRSFTYPVAGPRRPRDAPGGGRPVGLDAPEQEAVERLERVVVHRCECIPDRVVHAVVGVDNRRRAFGRQRDADPPPVGGVGRSSDESACSRRSTSRVVAPVVRAVSSPIRPTVSAPSSESRRRTSTSVAARPERAATPSPYAARLRARSAVARGRSPRPGRLSGVWL